MTESAAQGGFRYFVHTNKHYLWTAIVLSLAYFIALRLLYPIPSYFADSFTYVGAAAKNQPVSFRPVMYSKLIQLFRFLSENELALIAGQYFSSVLANLFLFFTTAYFFGFNRWQKLVLFVLLIAHPFYFFSSNYVSSDSFFSSFTVAWFTLLIWIMHRPRWYVTTLHIVLLMLVFTLRYNAVYFPFVTAIAIFFAPMHWGKKLATIATCAVLILGFIETTSRISKAVVGTKIFTGFSGWQFANNALHIVRFKKIDTAEIEDKKVKELLRYSQDYFSQTNDDIPTKASAWYMWHPYSPLKGYMKTQFPKQAYFRKWTALAPLYGKFGKSIILHHPSAYIEHFVLPNAQAYLHPRLEIYDTYFENVDTIAKVARVYYNHTTNRTSKHRPALYAAVFSPWPYIFTLVNVLLLVLGSWYWLSKEYLQQPRLVNRFLLCFAAFFFANFFFVVLLAPSVFRYHIAALTLSFPILLLLLQTLLGRHRKRVICD